MSGRSVKGQLAVVTIALDVLVVGGTAALMQQSHGFILYGAVEWNRKELTLPVSANSRKMLKLCFILKHTFH